MKVKVILYGIGALGRCMAKTVLDKKWLDIVGAVDISPNKIGKDLGEVLEMDKRIGISIDKADDIIPTAKADIVIHSTTSYLTETYPQIVQCIESGLNVVSTCEELSFPYLKHPDLADKLDRLAKKFDVTVLGTGVNPGFLMDTLPVVLTTPCIDVRSIKIRRVMYSGNRRSSYQKKIGTGMSLEEFNDIVRKRKISGHVGLEESIAMIASALNWELDDIAVLPPKPVVADEKMETIFTTINPNHVCGLKSVAQGIMNKKKVIVLEFISHAKVKNPYDSVSIKGTPNINERITGGVNGDQGTIGVIINAIPNVLKSKPGLLTMKDIALPFYREV